MQVEMKKTPNTSILWTETSPRSKLNTIKSLLDDNSKNPWIKKLLEFLKRKDYIWFQKEIGLTWNQLDGKLWNLTYNRLKGYIEYEFKKEMLLTVLRPVVPQDSVMFVPYVKVSTGNNFCEWYKLVKWLNVDESHEIQISKMWKDIQEKINKTTVKGLSLMGDSDKNIEEKLPSFIIWTDTSVNSKLSEILSLLYSFSDNNIINPLVALLQQKKYKIFQKQIWMESWFCDWKLWNLTLKYLDYYLKERCPVSWEVKCEEMKAPKIQFDEQNNIKKGYFSKGNTVSSKWLYTDASVSIGENYEIDHFDIIIPSKAKKIWDSLKWKEKPDLAPFACAWKVYKIEKSRWHLKNTKYLTIVDFTKNQQRDNRFFVINLDTNTVEYSEKCWHGKWSWDKDWAISFSNESDSNQSSLWAYISPNKPRWNSRGTWIWSFLKWQESSNNKLRWIAIHPVDLLVNESWDLTSEWCFTIPMSRSYVNEILAKINWWSLIFAYAKSKDYFAQSDYFKINSDGSVRAS